MNGPAIRGDTAKEKAVSKKRDDQITNIQAIFFSHKVSMHILIFSIFNKTCCCCYLKENSVMEFYEIQ